MQTNLYGHLPAIDRTSDNGYLLLRVWGSRYSEPITIPVTDMAVDDTITFRPGKYRVEVCLGVNLPEYAVILHAGPIHVATIIPSRGGTDDHLPELAVVGPPGPIGPRGVAGERGPRGRIPDSGWVDLTGPYHLTGRRYGSIVSIYGRPGVTNSNDELATLPDGWAPPARIEQGHVAIDSGQVVSLGTGSGENVSVTYLTEE